jgi:hypothetical protein
MTILFDENVPWPLVRFFVAHSVTSVQAEGWAGIGNGDLVARADARFDVLLLADKNLRYQQRLDGRTVALVELPTNRWPVLQDMAEQIVRAVEDARPGTYSIIDLP